MKTTVVNLRKSEYDIYIGRGSVFGNPYTVEEYGRLCCIEKYKQYLINNPQLITLIKKELKGKILGCFCKPLACHGDILAQIADESEI